MNHTESRAASFQGGIGRPSPSNLSALFRATHEGRSLASFRRIIGALLIVIGAPLIVLGQFPNSTTQRAVTLLALLWLFLVLPMVRVLCMEWQNNRLIERLRVLVDTDDIGGSMPEVAFPPPGNYPH